MKDLSKIKQLQRPALLDWNKSRQLWNILSFTHNIMTDISARNGPFQIHTFPWASGSGS